jgi:hypothetical protein
MMGPMMTLHNPRGTLSAHTALLINTCLKASAPRCSIPSEAKPYMREAVPLLTHSTQSPGRRFLAQSTAGSRQIPAKLGNSQICTLCLAPRAARRGAVANAAFPRGVRKLFAAVLLQRARL